MILDANTLDVFDRSKGDEDNRTAVQHFIDTGGNA